MARSCDAMMLLRDHKACGDGYKHSARPRNPNPAPSVHGPHLLAHPPPCAGRRQQQQRRNAPRKNGALCRVVITCGRARRCATVEVAPCSSRSGADAAPVSKSPMVRSAFSCTAESLCSSSRHTWLTHPACERRNSATRGTAEGVVSSCRIHSPAESPRLWRPRYRPPGAMQAGGLP